MIINTEDFKTYISLNSNDFDDTIALLIKGAIKWAETMINNKIEEQEVVEDFYADDIIDSTIFLSNTLNLRDLVMTYSGGDEVWHDFPDGSYKLVKDEGIVVFDFVEYGHWIDRATYKAGFTNKTLPDDLKLAILKIVGKLWNQRKSDGIKNENLGDAGITWSDFLSPDIAMILSKYKKFNV
jgi:hypothetical protein